MRVPEHIAVTDADGMTWRPDKAPQEVRDAIAARQKTEADETDAMYSIPYSQITLRSAQSGSLRLRTVVRDRATVEAEIAQVEDAFASGGRGISLETLSTRLRALYVELESLGSPPVLRLRIVRSTEPGLRTMPDPAPGEPVEFEPVPTTAVLVPNDAECIRLAKQAGLISNHERTVDEWQAHVIESMEIRVEGTGDLDTVLAQVLTPNGDGTHVCRASRDNCHIYLPRVRNEGWRWSDGVLTVKVSIKTPRQAQVSRPMRTAAGGLVMVSELWSETVHHHS
ncbi:hypothetical protein [Methylobacterium sp. J-070]|uniref:hypothetical protein n=1 Tax=Methylobacterium sp. J-070 TaxID=2836650 RepID=UPI001FB88AC2|nr:hypothetical protein [Methylobacterium sp. J-070]MCJ2053561.1 hypothetical protein [Methylobacterium sp. J-070]